MVNCKRGVMDFYRSQTTEHPTLSASLAPRPNGAKSNAARPPAYFLDRLIDAIRMRSISDGGTYLKPFASMPRGPDSLWCTLKVTTPLRIATPDVTAHQEAEKSQCQERQCASSVGHGHGPL